MKYIILFLFLFIPISLFAQKIPKDSIGIFNSEKKLIGIIKIIEFETLVKSSKLYLEEVKAEDNKQLKIVVKENPYIIKLGETFKADISITWYNEEKKVIKELVLENSLELKKENFHWVRVWYRDIAEYGFPSAIILLLILL